ncbi:MAG: protein kinase [Deltaproteobacteria bacterium]|nr:protein kinase [Deltaproteobacteria bacterium]
MIAAQPDTLPGGPPVEATGPPPLYGDWQPRHELGRGASGVVYLADHRVTGRMVALKALHASPPLGSMELERLERECRVLSRLHHLGLVHLVDRGLAPDGHPWLAMQWVDGPSLAEVLAHHPVLSQEEALRITAELVDALAALHHAGIAHRDLKPSNVLLDHKGGVHLADFGVVADMMRSGELTETGLLVGTLAYMAPEVMRGAHDDIAWDLADQWSLGALLHEMLLGARPHTSIAFPSSLPTGTRALVERLLRADPGQRYPHLDAFARDLQAVRMGNLPEHARPLHRSRRWVGQHRSATALMLLAATSAVGLGTVTARERLAQRDQEARWRGTSARVEELRAKGALDEADALLGAWIEDPQVQSDRLGEAMLDRAAVRRDRGDLDAALSLAARVASSFPDQRPEALVDIARSLWEAQDLEALGTLLPSLPPGAVPEPWRRDAALASGDLATAAAHAGGATAGALLTRWAHQRALPADTPRFVAQLPDLDGDGQDEQVEQAQGAHWVNLSGGERWALPPLPADGVLQGSLGDHGWLMVLGEGGGLWRPGREGLAEVRPLTGLPLRNLSGWGDAVYLATQGQDRDVYLSTAAAPEPRRIDPDIQAHGAYVNALNLMDLDGDGLPELVVALGPPSGYQVRVYATAPEPHLIARATLGYVTGLETMRGPAGEPRLIAVVSAAHPPGEGWGDAAGLRAGIHELVLEGSTLRRVGFTPPPAGRTLVDPLVASMGPQGPEVLLLNALRGEHALDAFVVALRQEGDGALQLLRIAGWNSPHIAREGVGTPALRVWDGPDRRRALALGEGPLRAPLPPSPPPADWADLLTWIDRPRAAAQAAEAMALSATEAEAPAWRRAAALRDRAGDHLLAAEDWLRASAQGDPASRQSALESLVQAGDLEGAVALSAEAGAPGPLTAWLAAEQRAEVLPGDALSRWATSAEATADPLSRATTLHAVPGGGTLLTLPFLVSGPDPGVALTLELPRAEFSAGIWVHLDLDGDPGGDAYLQARDLGQGGYLEVLCSGAPPTRAPLPHASTRHSVRLEMRRQGDRSWCFLNVDGDRSAGTWAPPPPPARAATGTLTVSAYHDGVPGALLSARIKELRLIDARSSDASPPGVRQDERQELGQRLHPRASLDALVERVGAEAAVDTLMDTWAVALSDPLDPAAAELITLLEGVPLPRGAVANRLALERARWYFATGDGGQVLEGLRAIWEDPEATARQREQAASLLARQLLAFRHDQPAAQWAYRAWQASPTPAATADALGRMPGVDERLATPAWSWLQEQLNHRDRNSSAYPASP